jgi:hypothetical protein
LLSSPALVLEFCATFIDKRHAEVFMEEERNRHANSLNDSVCNAHTRRPSSSSTHADGMPKDSNSRD